jgi:hypothetical protein
MKDIEIASGNTSSVQSAITQIQFASKLYSADSTINCLFPGMMDFTATITDWAQDKININGGG